MSLASGPPPPLLDALFWAAVASAFVWMLGPSADWLEGRSPSGEVAAEVAGAEPPGPESGQALPLGREEGASKDSAHVPPLEVVGTATADGSLDRDSLSLREVSRAQEASGELVRRGPSPSASR